MARDTLKTISIIGGGLAGCEAAWQVSQRGCHAVLFEMKPMRFSPAHISSNLAELVCSNSLRSNSIENASGLLKEEMRILSSLIMKAADSNRIPAGRALAVDRNKFSKHITDTIEKEKQITVIREEVKKIPADTTVIIATGPLTSESFSEAVKNLVGNEFLYFHDAVSPIVEADSINLKKAFKASRYDNETADYINCPLSRDEYYSFIKELCSAEKTPLKTFEKLIPYEKCMPVELMAERGHETLAHGPMKPIGLVDPITGKQPYAVVQLRQENKNATLYNMVGFQTRLKWPEQKRVFSMIPGLENARFVRYGSIHRNTYIHSPLLLLRTLQLKKNPRIFFAGQITGVEGYVESAAMGMIAGIQAGRFVQGLPPVPPPETTVTGALTAYITTPVSRGFQPMNANFGILPPLNQLACKKKERKKMLGERALCDMIEWKKRLFE